ncbi:MULTISPECIES: DUF4344 domain-containing metallopeptidase [Nostocales]|uniref:DUF4344 domain-containing metallopeptidase n=3 Tax=Nostocales TaxID=1161 RepID=A0A8S9T6I1_9CYAN|nr:DUF4344 domain-containing metallopeptidase [Tolypothrix bouteillei]KAF3887587.1 DUF4344 domain-containing metallopeptidase [Tolypothrix bouteillei VB521301]
MRKHKFLLDRAINLFSRKSLFQKAFAVSLCGVLGVNLTAGLLIGQNRRAIATEADKTLVAQRKYQPGKFHIVYGEVKSPFYRELQKELRKSKALEPVGEALNSLQLALPTDVAIAFTECGELNAYYNPGDQSIKICYDLLTHYAELFSKDSPKGSTDKAFEEAASVLFFVVLHETGHALVDLLKIPVTGREEDAVDSLAAVMLLEGEGENAADEIVINTARAFALQGQGQLKGETIPFADEHSLDLQRFANLACLVYGKNPEKYTDIVKKGILPKSRAAKCPSEYTQARNSWLRLLERHSLSS